MRRLASWWMAAGGLSAVIVAASIPCAATPACTQIEVQAHVQAATGRLTLADLLSKGSCAELQRAAAQVSFGAVPRRGSSRVLDGSEVRRRFADLIRDNLSEAGAAAAKIPERIVVERTGAMKDCAKIAQFIRSADSTSGIVGSTGRWQELNCAAARHIPEDAMLELTKKIWHATNRRWEFTLRCARPSDCVPFLVWAYGEDPSLMNLGAVPQAPEVSVRQAVKPGQTASLTWDERGIRIVAPVTCLDGGGVGQWVRVRFKNGPGILRAEVLSDGSLRASL
ncbi:MAG: hypothetical protein ACLQLC_14085 [Candidatus Sulfotelmatobacter sp.]